MAVEAEKLAERLRQMCWLGEEGSELLAEAVEYFGSPVFVRNAWLEQWLRRVAERVAAATEGGEGHER